MRIKFFVSIGLAIIYGRSIPWLVSHTVCISLINQGVPENTIIAVLIIVSVFVYLVTVIPFLWLIFKFFN